MSRKSKDGANGIDAENSSYWAGQYFKIISGRPSHKSLLNHQRGYIYSGWTELLNLEKINYYTQGPNVLSNAELDDYALT